MSDLENDVVILTRTLTDVKDERAKQLVAQALRGVVNRFTGVKQRKLVELTAAEIQALRNGSKFECIKLVKVRLNLSLMDAKNYVEAKMGPYYVAKTW